MKMVNIMECKATDCVHNVKNDCTKEAIVMDGGGDCEDWDDEQEDEDLS